MKLVQLLYQSQVNHNDDICLQLQNLDVPAELVSKGYGSFAIPPLNEGIFYKGKSDQTHMSGQLFPQPIKFDGSEIKERCDYLLGDNHD